MSLSKEQTSLLELSARARAESSRRLVSSLLKLMLSVRIERRYTVYYRALLP